MELRTALHAGDGLQLPAPFHGFQHGDLVGIFDVAAGWDAGGDAGDFAELERFVERRGVDRFNANDFDGWF